MISNQTLACRLPDDEGKMLFDLKTDGSVQWMNPMRKDEAAQIFCERFSVANTDVKEITEALKGSKLTMKQMGKVFKALK
jgi:hypothetical protein